MSVTDQALLEACQIATLNPPDAGFTWPDDLWTTVEVLAYANQRQTRMMRDTLLQVGRVPLTVTAGTLRVTLPEDWVRTVRVVWRGSDGRIKPLNRSDTWAADGVVSDWATVQAATPLVYMDEEAPTRTLQIAPAPAVNGTLDLYYIPTPSVLTLNPEILTVPDEEEPALRYGVLATMLTKDGPGRDAERAMYAEMRYQLGVDAAKLLLEGLA